MENNIIYDALSITTQMHSVTDIIDLLGLQELIQWQDCPGAKGYQARLYYDGISIHYDSKRTSFIWLELSGQGCRVFETFGNGDYEKLFSLVYNCSDDMHITRLDVAFNDHTGALDLKQIRNDVLDGNFCSTFDFWEVVESSKGLSVYHGSPQSKLRFRIYDKARERGFTDGRHWIRFEMQLRDERALRFITLDGSLQSKFQSVLAKYLRYTIPNEMDSNKWRWETAEYWDNFIQGAIPQSLYEKPGVEYNLAKLDDFVYRQAGNAILTALEIYGVECFDEYLKEQRNLCNLPPKYKMLIEQEKKRG